MTFEVEVGGRTRTVVIERGDLSSSLRVKVDGTPRDLTAVRVGEYGLCIVRTVTSSRRGSPENGTLRLVTDLQVTPGSGAGEVLVHLQGRTIPARINGRRRRSTADEGVHAQGDVVVTAPMPGRIVRVLVAPGDRVAARQGLIVVEAMKMENEMRAPRAGRVKEVSVAAGASVEAGRVLAVIE